MTQSTVILAPHQVKDMIEVLKIMEKENKKGNLTYVVVTQAQQQPSHLTVNNSLSDAKYISYDIAAPGGMVRLQP